jgi:hypothetical protein
MIKEGAWDTGSTGKDVDYIIEDIPRPWFPNVKWEDKKPTRVKIIVEEI